MTRRRGKRTRFTGARIAPGRALAIRALLDSGTSQTEIARREKMSRNTVRAIQLSDRWDPDVVDQVKKGLSAGWYLTAERAISRISDAKLDQSSAAQLTTIGAIATDKARLIDGLPTHRTEFSDKSDHEIEQEIASLEAELAKMKALDAEIVE